MRIAVADDELDTREFLAKVLAHLGYDVPAEEPAPEDTPAAEVSAEQAPAAADSTPAAAPAEPGEVKPVDKSKMTIEQMIAYCREHDSK